MGQNRQLPYREGSEFIVYDAAVLASRKKDKRRLLGTICLALSFSFFLVLFSPILAAEMRYRVFLTHQPAPKNPPKPTEFGQLIRLSDQGVIAPADWQFSLIIPKVGINTKVVSGVDISSEEEIKQALEIGVAQAKGTALPDEEGTIYLFGHSTDYAWNIQKYNAWLYPLKDLQPQDQIIIAFNNKLSFWQVKERKIAQATDLTYLSPPENGQRLVLQTCWPPGTTLKRLIVIAEPQEGLDKTNLLGLN